MKINSSQSKYRRQHRVAASLGKGSAKRPRVAVFRSLKNISAQVVDDVAGHTLVAFSSAGLEGKLKPMESAKATGEKLGALMKEKGIHEAIFDRRHYAYHGRVAALAEGLRAASIKI